MDLDCCANTMPVGRRIVCPKPRRPCSSNFTFATAATLRFHTCNDAPAPAPAPAADSLDLIFHKDGFEAEHCPSTPPSTPFLFGSPPCRTPNPLIKDAHFRVGKATMVSSNSCSASPPTAPTRVKLGSKQATVRVEGFECQSPRAVAMA